MRSALLTVLLAACAPAPQGAAPLAADAAAPPFTLTAPATAYPGDRLSLRAAGAPGGATVTFYGSLTGTGPCPGALGGDCLRAPVVALGAVRASPRGGAALDVTVPGTLSPGPVWLQARHGGRQPAVTAVVTTQLEPPPPIAVSGHVSGDGVGPALASIELSNAAGDTLLGASGLDGAYALDVPPGDWHRRVSATGYADAEADVRYTGVDPLPDQDVVLQPTAAFVRVTAVDGGFAPIPDAQISLSAPFAAQRLDLATWETVFEAVAPDVAATLTASAPGGGTSTLSFAAGFPVGGTSVLMVIAGP